MNSDILKLYTRVLKTGLRSGEAVSFPKKKITTRVEAKMSKFQNGWLGHTLGMDLYRSDFLLIYKKTCREVFCLKLDGQWTSKMVVFYSCTNRQETMSFMEFHGQKDMIVVIFFKTVCFSKTIEIKFFKICVLTL